MNTRADTISVISIPKSQTQFYPWVIVLFSSLFLLYKYVVQNYPSIITQQLMQTFNVNATGLGSLGGAFFYSYFITQFFVGILLDRLSARFLTSTAILICAIGTYWFAIADSLTSACLARLLIGVGCAFATVSYIKLAANWFDAKKFAFVTGLLATAAMLGAILGKGPLAALVGVMGWRYSFILCAWVGIFIAIAFFLVVRDRPKNLTLMPNQHAPSSRVSLQDFGQVVRNKQNWLLMLYAGTAFSPISIFGGLWADPFFYEAYHLSPIQTGNLVSMIFLGLAFGAPIIGYFSDRLGVRRKMMLFGTILSLVAVTMVIYLNGLPIIVLACLLFLFGFGMGGYMLGFSIGKEINPIALAATVMAMINLGDAIVTAITEQLIGKFLDLGWDHQIVNGVRHFSLHDFHISYAIIPIYLLIAMLSVFFIKEKRA